MVYVLIFVAYIGRGGVGITHEFTSEQACKAAFEEMVRQRQRDTYGGCFPKN